MSGGSWAREDRGQAIPLLAIMITVLMLFVALAINSGGLFVSRRVAQEAADAGAWGGAIAIQANLTQPQIVAQALEEAGLNGFTGPTTTGGTCAADLCVDAYNPPISGSHVGDNKYVEVVITETVKGLLLPSLNSAVRITTRAVGGAKASAPGYALVTLSSAGSPSNTFQISGNGGIQVNNGDLLVDSAGACAARDTGAGSLDMNGGTAAVTGSTSGVCGDFAVCPTNAPDCFSTGATPIADPIVSHKPVCNDLPADPAHGNCSGSTVPVINSINYTGCSTGCTLSPGFYTTVINPPDDAKITFAPGLYVLSKGLTVSHNNVTLTGTGVSFFNTHSNYPTEPNPPFPCGGGFSISSQTATLTLAAPLSGTYKGMLLYQDCANDVSISSSANVNVTAGTIYAPYAKVTMTGPAGGQLTVSQIVAKTVNISAGAGPGGGPAIVVNYDPAKAADSNVGGSSPYPYLAE